MSALKLIMPFWAVGAIALSINPEEPSEKSTIDIELIHRIQTATEKGLAYLAKTQNNDGSWTAGIGYKLGTQFDEDNYKKHDGKHVGVTSLACMAFMSAGHYPDRGKYANVVKKGLDFILSCMREDGYITYDGSRMYEHAFAVLFLSHVYSMTNDPEVRNKLKKSINLLVQAQNKEGGWRYQPQPIDADLSVTVSVLQALRSARNVGISVPKITIDNAMKYIENCIAPAGFHYQSPKATFNNDNRTSYSLAACGVVSLNSAGYYLNNSEPVYRRALLSSLNYLKTRIKEQIPERLFYFYGHYYACQAMYMAGGAHWRQYHLYVFPEILDLQRADGSWRDIVGQAYATSMALIILQVPNEQFPIFQR